MAAELEARPRWIRTGRFHQRRERGADPLVHLRWFAPKPRPKVPAARERARLEPERGRVIALSHLNAHAVLPRRWIERPEELPAANADRRFQPLAAAPHLGRLIPGAQEHHLNLGPLDRHRRHVGSPLAYPGSTVSGSGHHLWPPYAEVRRSTKAHDYWEGED